MAIPKFYEAIYIKFKPVDNSLNTISKFKIFQDGLQHKNN